MTKWGHQNGNKEQKPMCGLQDEGRRRVENLCGGKFGKPSKIEWDIHVGMLAHPSQLFLGL
jgi:hypothetical protein